MSNHVANPYSSSEKVKTMVKTSAEKIGKKDRELAGGQQTYRKP